MTPPRHLAPDHTSPCGWSQAAIWSIGVLTLLGAGALGSLFVDSRELRETAVVNQTNIREVQTDIRYMRESLSRIESAIAPRTYGQ